MRGWTRAHLIVFALPYLVLLAARSEGDQRLIEESADLIYHLFVMLAARGLTLTQVEAELARRHQPDEKA